MGVSVRTIEHHRTQLMRKLKTNSIPALLRFALTVKRSSPRFLENALSLVQDGNGLGSRGREEFIPHNGFHTQEAHQSSTPKSPAVTGPAVKGPGRGGSLNETHRTRSDNTGSAGS